MQKAYNIVYISFSIVLMNYVSNISFLISLRITILKNFSETHFVPI